MNVNANLGPQVPTDILEMRAAEQRRRLHASVTEFREQVRERLDVRRTAREYLAPAAGIGAVLGLILGYGMGGMVVR